MDNNLDDEIFDFDDDVLDDVSEPSSEPIATEVFDFLKEQSLLDVDEDFEFDGTPEKLEEAIAASREKITSRTKDNLLSKVHPSLKEIVDYALGGGDNLDAFIKISTPINLETIDLSSEENQRKVIFDYWKATSNHSDEKINRMINKIAADEELYVEAQDALEVLKSLQEEDKVEMQRRLQDEQKEQKRKQQESSQKLIDALKESSLLEARQNKIKALFFNPLIVDGQETTAYVNTLRHLTNNPQHLIQFADILLEYNPEKGFDMSKFEKRAQTKTNQTFRQLLQEKLESKIPSKGTHKKNTNEDFDWDQFLSS